MSAAAFYTEVRSAVEALVTAAGGTVAAPTRDLDEDQRLERGETVVRINAIGSGPDLEDANDPADRLDAIVTLSHRVANGIEDAAYLTGEAEDTSRHLMDRIWWEQLASVRGVVEDPELELPTRDDLLTEVVSYSVRAVVALA